MMQLPNSSLALHRAAPFLAQLVACGLLGRAEAVAALLHAAAPARISPSGRQVRLPRVVEPVASNAPRARSEAAAAARRALAQLLPLRVPTSSLIAAAAQAAGPALCAAEIHQLMANEIALHLRRQRHAPR